MAKQTHNREITERDKEIYRAASQGKYIKLKNSDEILIYEFGLNSFLVCVSRLERENKHLKNLIDIQNKSYAKLCTGVQNAHHELVQQVAHAEDDYPIFHITLSLDDAKELLKKIRYSNIRDRAEWWNRFGVWIKKLSKLINDKDVIKAETSQKLYEQLVSGKVPCE